MHRRRILFVTLALSALFSCKEKFEPKLPSPGAGYLVIEGNLNPGQGSTIISLSRTYPLDAGSTPKMENNALVTVEGSDGSVQTLPMTTFGTYMASQLQMSANNTYKLHIKTTDGKDYLSDGVTPSNTPPIDSIGWKRDGNGVSFYVNAKGTAGDSRYYRWEYDETWEIRSFFYSLYKFEGTGVRERRIPEESVFNCWKYNNSGSIILGSSAALSSNVIHEKPLFRIPAADEKLAVRYSVLLRQYSLNKEAYEFYELMKKNTELLGSIFDVQPSELRGNIHCINDDQAIAIGYITASTVNEKRIFVDTPQNWGFTQGCASFRVVYDSIIFYFLGGGNIPIDQMYDPRTGAAIGYMGATAACVDCVRRGGNLAKPSYW